MKNIFALFPLLLLASCGSSPQTPSSLSSSYDFSVSSEASPISSSVEPSHESSTDTSYVSSKDSSILSSEESVSSQAHVHTFESGYHFDETTHWKEATCGHDVRDEVGEHVFSMDYDVKEDVIIARKTCGICGYFEEESTENENLLDGATVQDLASGGVAIALADEHLQDMFIAFPREVDGKKVESIRHSSDHPNRPSVGHSVIFLPSTVKTIRGSLAHAGLLDIFYEGTLSEYLTLDVDSDLFTNGRFNLHLLDDQGGYYLLEDLVLPNGLLDFDGMKYFTSSTIKTLVCNEELLTFSIGGCDYLREIRFNEGLTSILGVVALPLLHGLIIPSSVQTIGYLGLNHLYSLTISQGAPKTLSSYSIRSLPRLVAMFDHRDKAGRSNIPLPATVLYTEENESDFRLVQDGDFLLVKDTEEYLLLDYYGTSFEVTIPSAFHDGEKEITSFRMFDSFCYSGILSGGPRQAFEDEEILLHEHFIA
ncbi:MAG: hypothetical protein IJS52_05170, partial [Bacilli bacterium]|nr:hypothetical protein [Bacilli bacterium]